MAGAGVHPCADPTLWQPESGACASETKWARGQQGIGPPPNGFGCALGFPSKPPKEVYTPLYWLSRGSIGIVRV